MSKLITHLADNEVFVYGSNASGFSCSGSAGIACRGDKANTDWRTDPWVQRALRSPMDSPDRVGPWAIFGVSRGWSKGTIGMGYAIETIVRPGLKRSVPLSDIQAQIEALVRFVRQHPEWTFLFTAVGAGLAGYTEDEMAETFYAALKAEKCWYGEADEASTYVGPSNLVIPIDLYGWNWSW